MYAPEDAEPLHEWPEGKFEVFLEEDKSNFSCYHG